MWSPHFTGEEFVAQSGEVISAAAPRSNYTPRLLGDSGFSMIFLDGKENYLEQICSPVDRASRNSRSTTLEHE